MKKSFLRLAVIAGFLFLPARAQVSYDTAIFSAKNDFCNRVADLGGRIVDRNSMIDKAVRDAASLYKDEIKDRSLFRSRVVQAINTEGCDLRRDAIQPALAQPAPMTYQTQPVGPAEPLDSRMCVAVINGVRLKECSGRF
jgi:hypothetical protein